MKKKDSTKTFSVRAETELIVNFEKALANNDTNKNRILKEFMLNYVVSNTEPYDSENIDISDNIERLGYQKSFFTREDAVFCFEADKLLSDIPNFPLIELPEKEKEIERYINTGVKYSFVKIGISIYVTWYFYESKEIKTGKSDLNFGRVTIMHNEKDDTVDFIDNSDYVHFNN